MRNNGANRSPGPRVCAEDRWVVARKSLSRLQASPVGSYLLARKREVPCYRWRPRQDASATNRLRKGEELYGRVFANCLVGEPASVRNAPRYTRAGKSRYELVTILVVCPMIELASETCLKQSVIGCWYVVGCPSDSPLLNQAISYFCVSFGWLV